MVEPKLVTSQDLNPSRYGKVEVNKSLFKRFKSTIIESMLKISSIRHFHVISNLGPSPEVLQISSMRYQALEIHSSNIKHEMFSDEIVEIGWSYLKL